MNPYYLGVTLVLLSALGFGLLPIFTIFAYREGANVITLLFLRFSLASVVLFIYLWQRSVKIEVSRRQLGMLFLLGGLLYTLQSSCYFSSVRYIPASLTALLLYTYPIFVTLLSAIIDKEQLSGSNILAIALSTLGLILVLGAAPADINLLGVAFALAAAVVYSAYIVIGNRMVKKVPPIVTTAFVALFAACSFSLAGLATGSFEFSLTPIAWLSVLGIVAFATILAMLTFFRGLDLIGPTKASILSMMEPLITFAFSALFFGDHLSLLQVMGGAAVLAGAALVITSQRRQAHDASAAM